MSAICTFELYKFDRFNKKNLNFDILIALFSAIKKKTIFKIFKPNLIFFFKKI